MKKAAVKSTVKAAKYPAPAKSSAPAKKAPVKIVKKPAAAPVKRPAAAPVAKAPTVKPAPVAKPARGKQPPTVITALINIGFGNALYLRGEGPSLSWDVGVALDCVADDKWSITLPGTGKPVIYKFLINDTAWSAGSDYIVESGSSVTVVPSF